MLLTPPPSKRLVRVRAFHYTWCLPGGGQRRRGKPGIPGARRLDDVGRPRGRLAERFPRRWLQLHAPREQRVAGGGKPRADRALGRREHGLLPRLRGGPRERFGNFHARGRR